MYRALLLSLAFAPALTAAPTFEPQSSRQFFVTPSQASPLAFRVPTESPTTEIKAVIRDLTGTEVGQAQATNDAGQLRMEITLPRGYYTITFPNSGKEFGVISQGAYEGACDPFFGIDSALSWLSKPTAWADKLDVLKYCGIGISRERLSWADVHPKSGEFDPQASRRYDDLRQLYKKAGIKVLEVFHNAPTWMQRDAAGVYPTDLVTASEHWQKVSAQWKDDWSALDIWNEPDIQFGGNQPADRYAALAKTIAYATHTAAPEVELGAVVLAYLTVPFLDLVARNGLLEQCDFFSFHFYKDPENLVGHVREIRSWLARSGHGSMPLWITEMGRAWPKDGEQVRPPRATDIDRARIFARDTIESRACGVASIFPFVFVDYSEKGSEMFGMMDVHGSPQGAMAAYVQAIRTLRGAEYLGDVKSSPGSRVFKKTDGTVVVAWLETEKPPFPVKSMEGLDGRALETPADGLTYLTTTLEDLGPELTTKTEAMALYRMAKESNHPLIPPSPIVLVPQVKTEGTTVMNRGYQLPDKAEKLALDLSVANLGPEEKEVTVEVRAPVATESGKADGQSKTEALKTITMTIPPRSTGSSPFEIDLKQLLPDATGAISVDFVPSEKTIAPASIVLLPSLGLGEYLKAFKYQFTVPITDLSRWVENSSGRTIVTKSAEGNWLLKGEFQGEGGRWIYPKLKLPQEVQNDRLAAVLVRARFTCPGENSDARLITYDRAAGYTATGYSIIPNDGEWHVALIPLSSFLSAKEGTTIGSQILEISLGFNTSNDTGELEVSDLYLLGN